MPERYQYLPFTWCDVRRGFENLNSKPDYHLHLLNWCLPIHAWGQPNAALCHDLLDTLQSQHLGLGDGIHDVLSSKFIQIYTEKGDQKVPFISSHILQDRILLVPLSPTFSPTLKEVSSVYCIFCLNIHITGFRNSHLEISENFPTLG